MTAVAGSCRRLQAPLPLRGPSNSGRNLLLSFLLRDTQGGMRVWRGGDQQTDWQLGGPKERKPRVRLSVFPGSPSPKKIFRQLQLNQEAVPSSTNRQTFFIIGILKMLVNKKKKKKRFVGKAAALEPKNAQSLIKCFLLPQMPSGPGLGVSDGPISFSGLREGRRPLTVPTGLV